MGDSCINEHISDLECLNESSSFPVKNVFQKNDTPLKSDADHQLLIKIQFRQPVKISGLRFHGIAEGTSPTEVKLFINQPHIGFSDADDNPSVQDLLLTPKECNLTAAKDVTVPVRYVKFQCVNDLEIFVNENHGNEDVTELKFLEIFGETAEKSNIAEWKPVKG